MADHRDAAEFLEDLVRLGFWERPVLESCWDEEGRAFLVRVKGRRGGLPFDAVASFDRAELEATTADLILMRLGMWRVEFGAIRVHLLRGGYSVCGRFPGQPSTWPPGHRWAGIKDRQNVNCADCLERLGPEILEGTNA